MSTTQLLRRSLVSSSRCKYNPFESNSYGNHYKGKRESQGTGEKNKGKQKAATVADKEILKSCELIEDSDDEFQLVGSAAVADDDIRSPASKLGAI